MEGTEGKVSITMRKKEERDSKGQETNFTSFTLCLEWWISSWLTSPGQKEDMQEKFCIIDEACVYFTSITADFI